MKQFVTLLIMILCSTFTANAQNYLDHLKKKEPGKGVVTVNQSKAIDELVNGKQVIPQDDKTKTTPQKKEKEPETQHKQGPDSLKKTEPQHHEATRENAHVNNAQKAENKKEETETPVVDMRKKVMRKSYKVTGYRVQAFAGGNSRNDRLKAEQTGNQLKVHFPEQPVYVHFYSPRWIHLASVAQVLDSEIVGLGAENCADKAKGAFTGEVSAEMVKSTGAQYVILGHSERRQYYGETAEILKEKVELALANGLKVIFCCGETLEEREAEKQNEVVKAELEGSVFHLSADAWKNIILAYEPIWAIGTGKTATSDQAEEMLAYIRSIVAEKYGNEAAEDTSILYGGSCKASNAPELFAKPNIDGGLIGGASLKAADFKGIIDAWKK
jgi:triosephosphate isomerase